ncbi:MAG: glycosyltransferase family 2 protein, partial [Chitinispirillia bacterium]
MFKNSFCGYLLYIIYTIMITPLISVIIPTYNRKDKCRRAVESVINQKFKNFEIIVIDDCSTDGTCAEYLYGNSIGQTCRYYRRNINSGVSKARNYGIFQSKGKWIAFLDSDDEWLPDKLEKQIQWVYENPSYHIVQTREIWIRN